MSTDLLAKGLNISYVSRWENAYKFSKKIIKSFPDDLNPEKAIIKFVSDEELKSYFGGGDALITIISGNKPYDVWLMELWGRRCSYYITQLSKGMKSASNTDSGIDKEITNSMNERLEDIRNVLNERFRIERNPRVRASVSLEQRRDVANFHVTYLDPILFSSLYVLFTEGEHLTSDQKNYLHDNIKKEFLLYTKNGDKKVGELIADESTIWWAFIEILKAEGINDFSVGSYKGREGAIAVCLNLINNNHTFFPDTKMSLMEATPEIYGRTRTCMLVAKNVINFIKLAELSPYENNANKIFDYVSRQVNYVVGCAGIDSHAYLNGLFLESFSLAYDIIISPEKNFILKLEQFINNADSTSDLAVLRNSLQNLCNENIVSLSKGREILDQFKDHVDNLDQYSESAVKRLSRIKTAYNLWEFFTGSFA